MGHLQLRSALNKRLWHRGCKHYAMTMSRRAGRQAATSVVVSLIAATARDRSPDPRINIQRRHYNFIST